MHLGVLSYNMWLWLLQTVDLLDDLVCVIIIVESMAWIYIFAYLCYICGCDKQQQPARHAAVAGQACSSSRPGAKSNKLFVNEIYLSQSWCCVARFVNRWISVGQQQMHRWRLSPVRPMNLGWWRAFPQLNLHSSSRPGAAAGQARLFISP